MKIRGMTFRLAVMKYLFSIIVVFTAVVLFSGCTVTIDHAIQPTELMGKSKTGLRVAVYNFADATNGKNGSPHFTYDNLSTLLADVSADSLRRTGYFNNVIRINETYNQNTKVPSSVNYVVAAEIKRFETNTKPHPLLFINPISIFLLIGLPTGYAEQDGITEVRIVLIDSASQKLVDEFNVTTKFGPETNWSSFWLEGMDTQKGGKKNVRLFADEFGNKLSQGLRGNLGLILLAKDPSGKEFLPGVMQAGSGMDDIMSTLNSDVDELPKQKSLANKKSYAIVIGIEKYRQKLPRADFATNDAQTVSDYLTKVLGYPEENVITLLNDHATKSDFEKYFERWLSNNVEAGSSIFVYYSGHGAPNPKSGDAYLVPYDADPSFIDQTGYPLRKMYDALGKLRAKEVVVALDSCFSGAGGRSVIAKGSRPLVMNLQSAVAPVQNMTVLAAASGSQTSSTYQEKGHGLLTYFMLKGIKNEDVTRADGSIKMDDLFSYVKPQVERVARKQYNNEQTPQLIEPKK